MQLKKTTTSYQAMRVAVVVVVIVLTMMATTSPRRSAEALSPSSPLRLGIGRAAICCHRLPTRDDVVARWPRALVATAISTSTATATIPATHHPSHHHHAAAIVDRASDNGGIAARVVEYRRASAIGDGPSGRAMLLLAYGADDAGTRTTAIVESPSASHLEGKGDGGGKTIVDSRATMPPPPPPPPPSSMAVETDNTKEEEEEEEEERGRDDDYDDCDVEARGREGVGEGGGGIDRPPSRR